MLKQDILIKNGTYNKNHAKVLEQRFVDDDFYDPYDLAQVKYEMLRSARETNRNIKEIAGKFGFSRAGFYKIKYSFEKSGVSSFVLNKTGPRKARKLTPKHQEFIDDYLTENPTASSENIAEALKKGNGLEITKRTVERYRSIKSKSR